MGNLGKTFNGLVLLLILSIMATGFQVRPVQANEVVAVMDEKLPSPIADTSAVWTGQYAYVFGGYDGAKFFDTIVRYDPVAHTVTTMNARLPTARSDMSIVWTGTYVYLFGGLGTGYSYLDDILRYDPTTDTVMIMDEMLPIALMRSSAVWSGEYAYIFGGRSYQGELDTIVKYDPSTGTATTMYEHMPTPREYPNAIWTGNYAYIFNGGYKGNLEEILRYDPATDTITTMEGEIHPERWFASAVWADKYAFIFGGAGAGQYDDDIIRYDPVADAVKTVPERLPTTMTDMSAVWTGDYVYIFGGLSVRWDNGWQYEVLDTIIRYDPDIDPPSISDISYTPASPTPDDPVSVVATITDAESGVESVMLKYSTDSGNTWTDLSMTSGSTYTGTIPKKTDGTTVQFKVSAEDKAGNSIESSVMSYTVHAPAPAIPGFPMESVIIGIAIAAATLAMLKRKRLTATPTT